MMKEDTIKILGARVHNLKNIDLEIPRRKLVVITGLSGSGKSSLLQQEKVFLIRLMPKPIMEMPEEQAIREL